jgi:hypothetical protein
MGDAHDVIVRLTQERALHAQDLARLYIHALHDHPGTPYAEKLEAVLAARDASNQKKMVVDAANMAHALQRLHDHLDAALEKERNTYTGELEALRALAPSNTHCEKVLLAMIEARKTNNATRSSHDAQQSKAFSGGGEDELFYSQEARQLWAQINQ